MPRKKIIRKVVDKKDEPIEPKEALKMLGIVTNNETALDAPVETSVIEEFVKRDVEEVPTVHVPQVHHVTISHREGPYEHSKIVGTISYHELTNSLKLTTAHSRCEAFFANFMNCHYTINEDGVSKIIPPIPKQPWITNLCKTTIGNRFEASEPWVYNEVG